ncbi:MAG: HGGxSTG domain-containing protein [Parachlamydiaceae bacterium]
MTRECGAKARTNNHKPCRQPAMANGRCRLHGGLSTGPKTPEGKQQARLAVLKHGFYTKIFIEERRQLHRLLHDQRKLLNDINSAKLH